MERRGFLFGSTATAAAAALVGGGRRPLAAPAVSTGKRQWKMVLAWPRNFPGLGTGSERLARRIETMSGGRIEVKVFGGGELVPPFESFDAVREGKVECAHTTPYYWMNKNRSFAFFTGLPAGLTSVEHNAWILEGGGQALWDEGYGDFGLKGLLAGNTSVQMFGWFKKEIHGIDDLRGLKMRIAGLAGEVLTRIGAVSVSLPGAEIMPALQSGVIDAAEWIGPYNDLAFGFHKIARNYYGPGFHEGGSAAELMINKSVWEDLPDDLRRMVNAACLAETTVMPSEMAAYNMSAARALVERHGVSIRALPDEVTRELNRVSMEVNAETAGDGDLSRRIWESWSAFRRRAVAYAPLSDYGYARLRTL